MIELIFDTETTGFPNNKTHRSDDSQPWVIQFAYILREDGVILEEKEYLINVPIPVPERITEITGLTSEHLKDGIMLKELYDIFYDLMKKSDKVIGHNLSFDLEMMRIVAARVKSNSKKVTPEYICTMKSAVPVCKIPGKYGNYKWPNLTEAYKSLINNDGFENAHTALADVKACLAVYDKLLSTGAKLIYE